MKYTLGRKIMTKLVGLRAKTYSYFIDEGSEDTMNRHKNRHNVFNRTSLISNDDKKNKINWCDRNIAYGTSKDLVSEKEEIKYKNIKKRYKND